MDYEFNKYGPDKSRQPSPREDLTLAAFYAIIVIIAMGGWLWFLGSLSWKLIAWAVSEPP